MQPQPPARVPVLYNVVFAVAVVAHLAIAVPMFALGLVAPLYAIAIFWLFWGLMLWVLVRLRQRRPLLLPLVPVVTAAAILGALNLGGELLGWSP
jgi:hypothetical protein